jgi:glyoxylase-like metal-dependent hydrolase (beta-lactamase superfamily II)
VTDEGWFAVRRVRHGVWLIAEPGHVCSWLVEGSERAALIDSGLGIAPVRPVVEALTSRPVTVVNSHYHFDHVGGNHEFDDIAIHRVGAPRLEETLSDEAAAGYMRTLQEVVELRGPSEELRESAPGALVSESVPRPLPPGFRPSEWTTRPSRATRILDDGDTLDLGGRELRVLHTPGHSPDGISLWDEQGGLLFAGDVLSYGHVYAHFADSDLARYSATLARLEDHAAANSVILLGHCERPVVDAEILPDTRAVVEQALRGGERTALVDVVGNRAELVQGPRIGVTVPRPGDPCPPLSVPAQRSRRLAGGGATPHPAPASSDQVI